MNKITERYSRPGKKVHLRHLSGDSRVLPANAASVIEVNFCEDPTYKVVTDAQAAAALRQIFVCYRRG